MVLDLTDNRNGKARKKRSEQTVAQVLFSAGPTGDLPPNTLALPPQNDGRWYNKVRHMRRDPTIGFLRSVYMAPIIAAEWTVVSDDPKFENAVPGIVENTVRFRTKFLRHTMRGLIDYGWQSFEVVRGQRATGELMSRSLSRCFPTSQRFSSIPMVISSDSRMTPSTATLSSPPRPPSTCTAENV